MLDVSPPSASAHNMDLNSWNSETKTLADIIAPVCGDLIGQNTSTLICCKTTVNLANPLDVDLQYLDCLIDD